MSDITTLSAFYTEVTRLLDGEDPTVADISVSTLNRLLRIAQRRIYRDIRTRFNEVSFTGITTTGNAAALPADFEAASDVHFGGEPLEPIAHALMRQKNAEGGNGGGQPVYFARVANSFQFWPPASDSTALQGTYHARLADIDDTSIATNPLFQAADDLFIFACLVESGPFFTATDRMPIWEAKYQSIKDALNEDDMRAAYSAGRMKRKPSTRVIR